MEYDSDMSDTWEKGICTHKLLHQEVLICLPVCVIRITDEIPAGTMIVVNKS
jgi:hypothetical protein